jgi:hypothetical protein
MHFRKKFSGLADFGLDDRGPPAYAGFRRRRPTEGCSHLFREMGKS